MLQQQVHLTAVREELSYNRLLSIQSKKRSGGRLPEYHALGVMLQCFFYGLFMEINE
jgi:hypothetical protein